MSESYIDIIILAVIAGLVLFKLYNVLGKTDNDFNNPLHNQKLKDVTNNNYQGSKNEKNINYNLLKNHIAEILLILKQKDKYFDEQYFIDGARKAFLIIIEAFAKGDETTLKNLLDDNVYNSFINEIKNRKKDNTILEKSIISIISSDFYDAKLDKDIAKITVKFVSEQVNVIKNTQGVIIHGNPEHTDIITDIWVFSKDINQNTPTWQLIATSSEE